jgi:hypothetical protein
MARQRIVRTEGDTNNTVPKGALELGGNLLYFDNEPPLTRGRRADLVTKAPLPANGTSGVGLKCVLFVLDQFSGQNDRAWPSIDRIAACACLSARSVQRAVAGLVELGVVEYVDRIDDGPRSKHWISNRAYRINYHRLAALGGDTLAPPGGDSLSSDGVTACRPGGCHPVTLNKHTGTPQKESNKQGAQSAQTAPDWIDRIRPDLVQLGVEPKRVRPLCERAGSAERVEAILRGMKRRISEVRSPAAWFAQACGRPDWRF